MYNEFDFFENKPVIDQTLNNGLHLVIKEDPSAELCSVQFLVKTGSIHEEHWLGSGISHFLEHMLFKGTEKRDHNAISKEIESLGGTVNAYTTFDRTVYYINGPSEALLTFTDILRDMVFHAIIPDDTFNSERDVIFREIDMYIDDPDQQLSQASLETVFLEHPYRLPIIGHKDLFSKIRRQDLWEFYRKHYIPNNIIVGIVTNKIESDSILLIKNSLSVYPRGFDQKIPIQQEPVQTTQRRLQIEAELQTTRGCIAYRVPNMRSTQNPSLQILSLILGKGELGILNQEIRKIQEKVTWIDCSIWNSGSEGVALISYTADHDAVNEIENSIENLWRNLEKETFSQTILDRAKRKIKVAEINSYKTFSGQASRLTLNHYWHGTQESAKKFFEEIKRVDTDNLNSILNLYFRNGHGNFVSLIPKKNNPKKRFSNVIKVSSLNPTQHQLSNGIKVVLLEKKGLPKLNARANFLGGPLVETPTKKGLSSLMTHLLCFDAGDKNANQVSNTIESLGGIFSDFSGNQNCGLVCEVLSEDWEVAIDLMSSGVTKPQFQKTTYDLEKKCHLAQIKEEIDDIFYYGLRKVRKNFFGNHPLSSDPDGDLDTVDNINLIDCKKHWENIICGKNLIISAVGEFNSEDFLKKLEDSFSTLKIGKSVMPTIPVPNYQSLEDKVYSLNREQTVYFLSFPETGLLCKDNYFGDILNQILNGMSSRLFKKVREEKGLAYYVGSMRTVGLYHGMFTFYAGTNRSNLDAVKLEFSRELDRVRSGNITQVELDNALRQLSVQKRNRLHSIAVQSMEISTNVLHGLSVDHSKVKDEKIQNTTLKQLTEFAQKYLKGNGVSVVCGSL